MIQIEKNVPLPRKRSKYKPLPFASMAVGDSFLAEYEDHNPIKLRGFVASMASQFGAIQRPKWKFSTKAELNGVRCWRVI